jgi:hypothetical protein
VVPTRLQELMMDSQSAGAKRAMEALLSMKKLDISTLERAYAGHAVTT